MALGAPWTATRTLPSIGCQARSPRQNYDQFREKFGPGDVVVMSWPGCVLGNARLDALTRSLREDRPFFDAQGQWYFQRVVSGRETVAHLEKPPVGLSRTEAVSRLQGTLVGPDRETTCLAVTFTAAGLKQRAALVAWIRRAARQNCQVAAEDLHLAGPVIDGLTVDTVSKRALDSLAVPSTLIVFFVCYLCLGSVRGALLVVALSVVGQGVTLSLVHFAGDEMSALSIVMPPLIQVLAVAGGIHLVNYYAEARTRFGPTRAASRALRMGWLPCVLSAGTTALGLASLTTSELTPVRSFGIYASAGLLITTGLLLAFIPGTLMIWPLPIMSKDTGRGEKRPRSHPDLWGQLATLLIKFHGPVTAFCVGVMLLTGWGFSRIRTSVRIETLFAQDNRILSDYRWIEEYIGPSVPIEIVLKFDTACPRSFREKLEFAGRVEQSLKRIETIGGTTSALAFVPQFPARPDLDSDVYQRYIDQALMTNRPFFESMNYWASIEDGELLRVTANLSALADIDYGGILAEIRSAIAPLLLDANLEPLSGITANYTGIMPLVHEIQRQLMADLLKSFLAAVAMITLVMTLVHGSVTAGLVTMLSNVFPIFLMFGGLAWLDVPMDIGSVMTASVALGIAVDDTLHFLTFYRRGLAQGMSRQDGVLFAYRHCGRAMVQTSLACGLGLLVFALSDFVPTSRFAYMMFALLSTALIADLVLLPALLLGPLGRVFTDDSAKDEVRAEPIELVRPRRLARVPTPTARVAD